MKNRQSWRSNLINVILIIIYFLPCTIYLPFIVSNILTILLSTLWIIAIASNTLSLSNFKVIGILSIPFLIHLLSLSYSEDMGTALYSIEKKLSLLVFPLIIGSASPFFEKKHFRIIAKAYFITSGFTLLFMLICASLRSIREESFYTLFSIYEYKQWHFLYTELASYANFHPTYLSLLFLIAIIFRYNTISRNTLWDYTVYIFLFLGIVLLMSRIIVLSAILVSLYLLFASSKKYQIKFLILSFIAVLFFIMFANIDEIGNRFRNLEASFDIKAENHRQWNGLSVRIAEWQSAIDVISEKPLIGFGIGDAHSVLMEKYLENGFIYGYRQGYNTHNQYLEYLIGFGFIGLSLFLGSIVYPLIRLKNNKMLYLSFLIIFCVAFLTEVILGVNKGIVAFSLFQSLFVFFDDNFLVDKYE
ncbi:O-antigen ligase family protein [Marivirga tractuosa]|uniref:O-antigen ligase family protein n=1 Tax=Marivirga tractuosa TaxID=1006 RepID=UPI0035CFF384